MASALIKRSGKPRRFVRMFQGIFVPLIELGEKVSTVRPWPKRVPCPGDILEARMWTGKPYRSKQKIIACFEIREVAHMEIRHWNEILKDGWPFSEEEIEQFVSQEGFLSRATMIEFFASRYGLPFEGIYMRWGTGKKQGARIPTAEVL